MFQRWPKRDPNKHYYLVPNEVFNLGLTSHEIAVYNYLLRCEDRRTYQCHPSYRTIGRAGEPCSICRTNSSMLCSAICSLGWTMVVITGTQ